MVKGRKTSSDLSSGVTLAAVLDGDPRGQRCGKRNQLGGCGSDAGEG